MPTAVATPMKMKKRLATTAWRTFASRTAAAWPPNRRCSSRRRPNSFTSSMPLMFRVSFMIAPSRALCSISLRDASRSAVAKRLPSSRNAGSTAMPSSVSRHSSASITVSVAATETTLVMTSTSVLVTAFCAPATSLLSRLTNSPLLLVVKKRSDMRCRWAYRALRRSKMMPAPIAASSARCQMRSSALATGMAISTAASTFRRRTSPAGSVRSIRSRSTSGVSSPRPMVARMMASNSSMRHQ